jgi:hypothetical protein
MDRAERLRQVLSTRGLTLYRVSQQSARIFGRSSRYYVPHNLYSDVADAGLPPTIHQVFALSQITNYLAVDWLSVFGFDLDAIPRLQLAAPRQRTTLLDSSVFDAYAWIPWFSERHGAGPAPPIAPLGQFLASASPKRARDVLGLSRRRFLYAKIGEADRQAFPQFVPRSIVRVDTKRAPSPPLDTKGDGDRRFFFVECDFGCTCSQVVMPSKDTVILLSRECSCTQVELRLGKQARILGVVDAEIRPLGDYGPMPVPARSPALSKPRPRHASNPSPDLRDLLRNARTRAGLSFREASALSRWIAGMLSDKRYFSAASTLSDFETLLEPPRHIQRIISLCVLYCIDFWQFLRVSGLTLDQAGREPIPDQLVGREVPGRGNDLPMAGKQEDLQGQDGFLGSLLNRWEEIPLFLSGSLSELTGIKNFSLSDIFWVGGEKTPLHPWLTNATFVAVNRRIKRPAQSRAQTLCKQPLYVILKRDGSYLCGPCSFDQGQLIVHAYPGGPLPPRRFRNGTDVEVIGKVTTILRQLL